MQTHSWGAIWGLYSDNGKFERKWKSLSWVYIGRMEKKMETTITGLYRVNGTRTWKLVSWGYIGFRAQGFCEHLRTCAVFGFRRACELRRCASW